MFTAWWFLWPQFSHCWAFTLPSSPCPAAGESVCVRATETLDLISITISTGECAYVPSACWMHQIPVGPAVSMETHWAAGVMTLQEDTPTAFTSQCLCFLPLTPFTSSYEMSRFVTTACLTQQPKVLIWGKKKNLVQKFQESQDRTELLQMKLKMWLSSLN